MLINVKTSDSKVWNEAEVHSAITSAMYNNEPIVLDFLGEGPSYDTLGLEEYIQSQSRIFNYDILNKIEIKTYNSIEHCVYKLDINFPYHLVDKTFEYNADITKDKKLRHFGLFVGRGTAPRLYLSSYLYSNYKDETLHTNHLDLEDEFYSSNLNLERLIHEYNIRDVETISKYIEQCPIIETKTNIDKSLDLNPAQQLLQNDKDSFLNNYKKFFVEVVCETYFSGDTFFPTEKTWRPILLKTPFIIQGPQNYLKNLKDLGFKTFDKWWDEGYDEDPCTWSIHEITKVLDYLATKTEDELHSMYIEMQDVIEHNYNNLKVLQTQTCMVNYE
jgi:hypothetical protein